VNANSRSFRFSAMGCPCEVKLEGADDDVLQRAAKAARDEVERLDRKYSHYRDDSLVAQLAACADAGGDMHVDDETANLLDFSASLFEQSAARFDITAGPLTKLWDLQSARVPEQQRIDAALAHCGWQRVRWNRPHLHFSTTGMRLDLGGVVKEYAADRAAEKCREARVSHGVVDLGGDLAVIGAHIDGAPWLAGIKTPHDPARPLATIELQRGGLATSGDYERAMIVDGRRYSHIIDPRSGWPVQSFASVSVLAENCLVAGAAATLAMLFGVEEGAAWLARLGLPHLCVDTQGNVNGTLA